uniref:Ubiquitin-like protease family profile domain-containing protein n=1 Tax=Oryza glumipatula TaxID=40148 RepID=A0A0E0BKA7_9ORYZ
MSSDSDSSPNDEEFCKDISDSERKKPETSDAEFKKQVESAFLAIHNDTVLIGMKRKIYGHNFKINSMKSDSKDDSKLTRFSVKYFSQVLESLSEHQMEVISNSCFKTMLLFEKCSVPSDFALWIAQQVDVSSCDIIVRDKVIPLCKESVHSVLGLPVGGLPIKSSFEFERKKILECFGIYSLPSVKFYGDKFIKKESMTDEQILISFMLVNYLDFLNFGMRKLPADIPRIKVWKGNMIKVLSKFDRFSKGVYGKRPIRDISDCCYKLIQTAENKENTSVQQGNRSFLDMLHSSISVDLPEDVKKDINQFLILHFGPDESSIDERAKKLLIDVLVVLSNANVNLGQDVKSNFNDGNVVSDDIVNVHSSNAIHNDNNPMIFNDRFPKSSEKEQISTNPHIFEHQLNNKNPMNCNEKLLKSSQKSTKTDVDVIMKKLCKEAFKPLSPKKRDYIFSSFNKREPIHLDEVDEQPNFKIWDSQDDFPTDQEELKIEETPNNGSNAKKIIPDSYCPACPFEIHDNKDKIVMITLEDSEQQTQVLTQHNDKENVLVKQQEQKSLPKKKDSPDLIFLGERKCVDNCLDLTSKSNVLYNKINTFVVNPEKKLKLYNGSPEKIPLSNIDQNVGTSSSICMISKTQFQDKVAVDIDGVHCKFFTFGESVRPGGELSNFITSVFCRYMFRLCHPSKSKKHFFFSSIGDDLLKDPSTTDFKVVKKCLDGASLARPVHSCDLLFFPIVKNRHWFVFAVVLKAKQFVFLDSLYDEYSAYHEQLRPKLLFKINDFQFYTILSHNLKTVNCTAKFIIIDQVLLDILNF